ncbi:MAG: serine/threonine protein kinase [Akkermansiaceae bacterium]|nr:serine/threonine protein kinase [Akkermansiaceae bacterium]MCF7730086.1 serine/threonine protein kinase [Akkermansiaceae bacterium]
MTQTPYQREQRLFDEALETPPGSARDAFLEAACAGDSALRNSLASLLAADADAADFFDGGTLTLVQLVSSQTPEEPAAGVNPAIGTSIGPYQIVELIDEGGCGSVFVAEQTQPIRRRVALKIIRLGMDTDAVIARFEAERQALALMDHPNIAHVLDAGSTAAGLPFFVMELVPGSSITRYCDDHNVSIAGRLGLFVQVCHAIQHAHQKGVIHRDIKPSNILITLQDGKPVPKVIDFGIAKATDIPLTENTLLTDDLRMIGTPAYMSPEQAERGGQEIDTRSDIYSLGVVLYQLLTGSPPFDPKELARSGISELLRTLREVDPPLPAMALCKLPPNQLTALARSRGTDPFGLLSAVRGDLNWIVSKAMDKDCPRRYESAHGFAADIERHLAHEPVVAHPPTRRYRLRKLIRRNRVVFASAMVMVAILIIATGVSTHLYLRERDARLGLVRAKLVQTSLHQEAERRRVQAEALQLIAETRERITQAVVLLRDGDFPAADALVAGASLIRPTPEGAEVFRRLGDWHAVHGRWEDAAARFSYLIKVNYLDGSDTPSLDHLRAGPVLIESGDLAGFERFRRAMVARFAKMPGVLSAERTVKVALLVPAGEDLMQALDPLIDVSVDSLSGLDQQPVTGNVDHLEIWRMDSVALGEYRRGRFDRAEAWSRACLEFSKDNSSREATARILLALALHQQGRVGEARSELAPACAAVATTFGQELRIDYAGSAWWFDWLIARILLREAEELIGHRSATGDPHDKP